MSWPRYLCPGRSTQGRCERWRWQWSWGDQASHVVGLVCVGAVLADSCSEASAWKHWPGETIFLHLLFSFHRWFSNIYSTQPSAGQDLERSICLSAASPHPVPDAWREGPTQLTWPLPPHYSFKPTQVPQARVMHQHPSQLQARVKWAAPCPHPWWLPGGRGEEPQHNSPQNPFLFPLTQPFQGSFKILWVQGLIMCNWFAKPPLSVLQNATITCCFSQAHHLTSR